jgi:hypothetical protein
MRQTYGFGRKNMMDTVNLTMTMKMTPKDRTVTAGFWNSDICLELERRNREDKRLKPLSARFPS